MRFCLGALNVRSAGKTCAAPAPRINLNADLGESFGARTMGRDSELLQIVNSANVACGFHAGDPRVMRQTVATAKRHGVSIGAHPSYPDLQGFGRRRRDLKPAEREAMVVDQMGALQGIAAAEGHAVTQVKVHGALSNGASEDIEWARCVARAFIVVNAVSAVSADLILLAPALSELVKAGHECGPPVVEEFFADRNYTDDGDLVSRAHPQAMVHGAWRRSQRAPCNGPTGRRRAGLDPRQTAAVRRGQHLCAR